MGFNTQDSTPKGLFPPDVASSGGAIATQGPTIIAAQDQESTLERSTAGFMTPIQAGRRWTGENMPSHASSISRELERIAGLRPDWDSYGSAPPSSESINVARRLVGTVYGEALLSAKNPSLPYSIAPLSGGGVQLEWRGENKTVEVQVGPSGAFGYLLIKGVEPTCESEEEDDVPESRILELVRSVQR
jgi:hypothetical protein